MEGDLHSVAGDHVVEFDDIRACFDGGAKRDQRIFRGEFGRSAMTDDQHSISRSETTSRRIRKFFGSAHRAAS